SVDRYVGLLGICIGNQIPRGGIHAGVTATNEFFGQNLEIGSIVSKHRKPHMLVSQPGRYRIHDNVFSVRVPVGMITAPTKRGFLVPLFPWQALNDIFTVYIKCK